MKRFVIMSLLVISSCKTSETAEVKAEATNETSSMADGFYVIFESVPLAPSVMQNLGVLDKGKTLFIGKGQNSKKEIKTILYSTDQYDVRIAPANDVIDFSRTGESFSWTELQKSGKIKGKYITIENNLITEFCSGSLSSACKLKYDQDHYVFDGDGTAKTVPSLKSYAMTGVKASFELKETLRVKFDFSKKSLPVNIADSDRTEYSIGLKCKDTSYTMDYFSNQVAGLSNVTVADLASKAQRSIWTAEGKNLMIDDNNLEKDFSVSASGTAIFLEFKGDLMNKIKSECGEKIRKNAFLVDGALIRPS